MISFPVQHPSAGFKQTQRQLEQPMSGSSVRLYPVLEIHAAERFVEAKR